MIFINEWLPNPAGSDTQNEWVELFNSGTTPLNLGGWILKTSGTSKTKLTGTISAGEYLLLKRSATKLVLKNTDEKLFLYDASGKLVDQSGFLGTAPEGKSFARISSNEPTSYRANELFSWSDPTPGAANTTAVEVTIAKNIYPPGALNKGLGTAEFIGILFGVAAVLTAVIIYAIKENENLSKLFFRRDEAIR